MKKGILLLAALLCVLAPTGYQAFADMKMGRHEMTRMHENMWSKMDTDEMFFYKEQFVLSNAEKIGLTDEQTEKIHMLKYNVKKDLIKTDADIESSALDIKEELTKGQVDMKKVNMLIDKKYSLKADKAKALVKAYVDLKSILSKEQIDKLKKMVPCGIMKKYKQLDMDEESEQ